MSSFARHHRRIGFLVQCELPIYRPHTSFLRSGIVYASLSRRTIPKSPFRRRASRHQRKTNWVFESLEGLMAVLEGVPLFVQNARAIHLEIMEDVYRSNSICLYAAIGALAVCPHITELSTRLADNINLSAIAASFPSLESLSCPETNNFYRSLDQLGRMRMLRVSAWKALFLLINLGFLYDLPKH